MKTRLTLLSLILFLFFSPLTGQETDAAVRGVWVPAPRFTSVLHTYKDVKDFVGLLDELNMNSIFLVSYADNQTIYKSQVLTRYSTHRTPEEGYMLAPYMDTYRSVTNDPIRDLLDEAHKKDIKVFFWFEYGFMGAGRPIAQDDPLLSANPSWVGIGNDGNVSHYNQHDYYFNAYDPAVQQYIIELIEEAIELYPDVDGVQGDDRLPAMPRNSGYDPYTVQRYQNEHAGSLPPQNIDDTDWVKWRLDILNDFARRLYARIKAKNANVLVSFAPNPYPWCEEKLMQDWPQWCKDGVCDLLAVQCYRYNADAYRATVSEVLKYVTTANPNQLLVPGIILMEGSSLKMNPDLLRRQLQINRELGLKGEIYFYNKAIEQPEFQEVWKEFYSSPVRFPR